MRPTGSLRGSAAADGLACKDLVRYGSTLCAPAPQRLPGGGRSESGSCVSLLAMLGSPKFHGGPADEGRVFVPPGFARPDKQHVAAEHFVLATEQVLTPAE